MQAKSENLDGEARLMCIMGFFCDVRLSPKAEQPLMSGCAFSIGFAYQPPSAITVIDSNHLEMQSFCTVQSHGLLIDTFGCVKTEPKGYNSQLA